MNPEERIKRLNTLKQLLDDGVLTKEEVEQEKIKILQSIESPSHNSSFNHKEDSFTAQVPVEHKGAKQRVYWICGICGAALFLLLFSFLILKQKDAKTNRESRVDSASIESPVSDSHSGIINGHEWIDLGLPSGIKWATCNVGASDPEDYGDYFAWGEISSKDVYTWASYKFNLSSEENIITLNKYWDENIRLDLEDDAAWANWGNGWRIPTLEEVNELIDECSWSLSSLNGVNGSIVVGPNGNSIFLPSAGLQVTGLHGYSPPDYKEKAGYYYTSTLGSTYMSAYYLVFNSNSRKVEVQDTDRYAGMSIRPVVDSND